MKQEDINKFIESIYEPYTGDFIEFYNIAEKINTELLKQKSNNNINSEFILKYMLTISVLFSKQSINLKLLNIDQILYNIYNSYFTIQTIYLSTASFLDTAEKTIKKVVHNYDKLLKNAKTIPEQEYNSNTQKKFRYRIETVDLRYKNLESETDLNFLGERGWEIVSINFTDTPQKSIVIFKQEI
jgi:hypothetical protein